MSDEINSINSINSIEYLSILSSTYVFWLGEAHLIFAIRPDGTIELGEGYTAETALKELGRIMTKVPSQVIGE